MYEIFLHNTVKLPKQTRRYFSIFNSSSAFYMGEYQKYRRFLFSDTKRMWEPGVLWETVKYDLLPGRKVTLHSTHTYTHILVDPSPFLRVWNYFFKNVFVRRWSVFECDGGIGMRGPSKRSADRHATMGPRACLFTTTVCFAAATITMTCGAREEIRYR